MLSFFRLKVISSLFFVFFTLFCIVIYLFFFHGTASQWSFWQKTGVILGMSANGFVTYLLDREINYDKSNNWTGTWMAIMYQFAIYFFGSSANLGNLYALIWMNSFFFLLLKRENIQPSEYFLLCLITFLIASQQEGWRPIMLLALSLYPIVYKKLRLFFILLFTALFLLIYVKAYNFIKPADWPPFLWDFTPKSLDFSFLSFQTEHLLLFIFIGFVILFGFFISQTKFLIKKENIHQHADWLFFVASVAVAYCYLFHPVNVEVETKIILSSFFGISFNFLNKKLKYPMILDVYLWVFLLSIFILP